MVGLHSKTHLRNDIYCTANCSKKILKGENFAVLKICGQVISSMKLIHSFLSQQFPTVQLSVPERLLILVR